MVLHTSLSQCSASVVLFKRCHKVTAPIIARIGLCQNARQCQTPSVASEKHTNLTIHVHVSFFAIVVHYEILCPVHLEKQKTARQRFVAIFKEAQSF